MKFKSIQIKGHGRGKKIGFPTINLKIPDDFSLKDGIYAATVIIGMYQFKGALHFGPIPIFSEDKKSLEVYLIDLENESFKVPNNQEIEISIIKRIRGIKNFDRLDALTNQISADVRKINKILSL